MPVKWYIVAAMTLLSTGLVTSQEVVTGLTINRKLGTISPDKIYKSAKGSDTLDLPFVDDFSDESPFPSSALWDDKLVFINNTFSVNQVTQGVATFDCLDETGKLYEEASTGSFPADSLTSASLNLSYSPEDGVFMSFYYEAGGIADMPESNDSLTLHFWSPSEERWYSVWRSEGESTDGFRRVMIPVTSPRFLEKGFRFRFVNYASLSGVTTEPSKAGNADLWNIDYVILDAGRDVNDTVVADAAMTLPLRSLVKKYEAMPWRQFRQAYLSVMSPNAEISYRNNEIVERSLTRQMTIRDVFNNKVVKITDATILDSIMGLKDTTVYFPIGYNYNNAFADNPDSALFLVSAYFRENNSYDPKGNDTISFYQYLTDYYAIDDGSAEAGYGINGQGSRNAMAAIKFRAFLPDSVSAVRLCFNDAVYNANQRSFDIRVWADNNGEPGTLLGTTEGPVATLSDSINGFVTYYFDKPVRVNGYFWIGWGQLSETFLNVGLDLNNPPEDRQAFCLNGIWQLTQAPGTVMMRAVMTNSGTETSSDNNTLFNDLFRLFPNPTSGDLTLVPSDVAPDDYKIEVYNATGTKVLSTSKTDHPDVGGLPGGYYIMVIKTTGGLPVSLLRFIKTN